LEQTTPRYKERLFQIVHIDHTELDYELTETRNGLIAAINDLHKGRDTGRAWS